MDIAQMAVRCPKSRLLGTGLLTGYRFRIDGRGFATVDSDRACAVPGLVWELPKEDEASLDSYEGVPRCYTKQMLAVLHGEKYEPMLIYVSTDRLNGKPGPDYLNRIVLAAQIQGFPASYVDELKSWGENLGHES